MATHNTHVGLVLAWTQAGKQHRVTITGEHEKVLYEGDDMGKAKAVWDYTKEHYEQRRVAREFDEQEGGNCTEPDCPSKGEPHKTHLEGFVPYVNLRVS
jgi:hypothetical protein